MVVHTCGRFLVVIAGGRLCRCIHDAGPPAESSIRGIGNLWPPHARRFRVFVVFVCSWS